MTNLAPYTLDLPVDAEDPPVRVAPHLHKEKQPLYDHYAEFVRNVPARTVRDGDSYPDLVEVNVYFHKGYRIVVSRGGTVGRMNQHRKGSKVTARCVGHYPVGCYFAIDGEYDVLDEDNNKTDYERVAIWFDPRYDVYYSIVHKFGTDTMSVSPRMPLPKAAPVHVTPESREDEADSEDE